jgi:anti-anti-sigma factor
MAIQKWSESIWILDPVTEPTVADELLSLATMLRGASEPPHVLIDLGGVKHINSSNLSQLLRLRRQQAEADRRLIITGTSNAVWSVFMTTGLDKLFDFVEDKPTALASMQLG